MSQEAALPVIEIRDLGRMGYKATWDYQEALLQVNLTHKKNAVRDAAPLSIPTRHYLLLVEHPPVYTLGKNGKAEHLLLDERGLQERGIGYYPINRGGDITYHGPGQLVAYPILDLEKIRTDIGWYLRSLEEIVIRLMARYGLPGDRLAGATGVWLEPDTERARKVCAMGVRCSRWLTMHGLALNVNTDLNYFSYIVPCGIHDKGVTSLQAELGREVDFEELKRAFVEEFLGYFGMVGR